jgi:hypothetical protein
MAIKKSELYSSLWKSCDELRGGMDASQYIPRYQSRIPSLHQRQWHRPLLRGIVNFPEINEI